MWLKVKIETRGNKINQAQIKHTQNKKVCKMVTNTVYTLILYSRGHGKLGKGKKEEMHEV